MTDQAAYRRYTAEAERLMEAAGEYSAHDGEKVALVQRATVWAALALAAAQERVQPADRPTDDGSEPTVIDREGDRWTRLASGDYVCIAVPGLSLTKEKLARQYGPLSAPLT